MKRLLFSMIVLICVSCKNSEEKTGTTVPETMAFDSEKWKTPGDLGYIYRKKMLGDLIKSDTIRPLDMDGIVNLLGEPTRTDNNHLFYTVTREKLGLLTLRDKTLVIKLRDDGSVEWIKVHK